MSEFITSVKAALYDRAVSPLFGIFATAWIVCNYKIFVILLSAMDAISKLIYIQYVLYPKDDMWTWVSVLFAPTLITIISIYVYPWVSKPVFLKLSMHKADLTKLKYGIDERYMNEKIASITRLSSEQRVNYQREIDTLNFEIDRHRKALDEATAEIHDLKESILNNEKNSKTDATDQTVNPFQVKLTEDQLRLLNDIDESPIMRSRLPKLPLAKRHGVDFLIQHGLVESGVYDSYEAILTSAAGRAYLVASGYDLL